MAYDKVWRALDGLVVEFMKRGEAIPADVIEDLRSAKTLIQVLKADPTHEENVPSIEMYLGNVESYLIFEAHRKFGTEFAEMWMQKLREARQTMRTEEETQPETASKFVSGVPRDQKWLRVKVSTEMPQAGIRRIAGECGLSTKIQPGGYMIVYGDDTKIKLFIQKTGEKLQRRKVE